MSEQPGLRLFIALDLPAQTRQLLHAWGREALDCVNRPLRSNEAHLRNTPVEHRSSRGRAHDRVRHPARGRLLDADLQHVTISFLGQTAPEQLGPLMRLVETLPLPDPRQATLRCAAPLWLPKRHPRVLAVEIHRGCEWLEQLHSDVTDACAELAGATAPSKRQGARPGQRRAVVLPFRPHVTVARFPSGAADFSRALPATPELDFTPTSLGLYRSQLMPAGARYELLAAARLAQHQQ